MEMDENSDPFGAMFDAPGTTSGGKRTIRSVGRECVENPKRTLSSVVIDGSPAAGTPIVFDAMYDGPSDNEDWF